MSYPETTVPTTHENASADEAHEGGDIIRFSDRKVDVEDDPEAVSEGPTLPWNWDR